MCPPAWPEFEFEQWWGHDIFFNASHSHKEGKRELYWIYDKSENKYWILHNHMKVDASHGDVNISKPGSNTPLWHNRDAWHLRDWGSDKEKSEKRNQKKDRQKEGNAPPWGKMCKGCRKGESMNAQTKMYQLRRRNGKEKWDKVGEKCRKWKYLTGWVHNPSPPHIELGKRRPK